ncbi:MAG: hypothetical protein AB7N65_12730 [Vicinamibacterales bacterium]
MFKASRNLSLDGIADALGQPLAGRTLLEPINVLWIDGIAQNEADAANRVALFLENSFFRTEPFRHSNGYYGYLPSRNPPWVPQLQDETWTDLRWPNENNHGRAFASLRVVSDRNAPVFLTIGAFSRERDCFNLLACHWYPLNGFNEARDALVPHRTNGWTEQPRLRLGNEYPVERGFSFTTELHDGVRVFEASRVGVCDQITNIRLVPAPYGDPDKAQASFDFPPSMPGGANLDFTSYGQGANGTWVATDWWRERVQVFGQPPYLTPYIDKPWRTRWRLALRCDGRLLAEREGPAGT